MKKPEIIAAYKADPLTEFSIVKAGVHYSRDQMASMLDIKPERTIKVKLVDLSPRDTRYTQKHTLASWHSSPSLLPPAQPGDKRPGLLVIDEQNFVFVIEPSAVINTSAVFESVLANHASLKAIEAAELAARDLAERRALVGGKERADNAGQQLRALIADLLGNIDDFSCSININTQLEWKDNIPKAYLKGDVRLDYKLMLKLTNLIQDLKEKENN